MLPEQSITATQPLYPEQPMSMSMPQHSMPAGTAYMQQESLPQSAAPAMPAMQQPHEKSSSPRSSDGKEEVDYGKLQERIQKQKEKNARNQRQFRKRVRACCQTLCMLCVVAGRMRESASLPAKPWCRVTRRCELLGDC